MTESIKSGQSNGTVSVTPSGIPIYYQSKPKRLYRVGNFDGSAVGLTPEELAEDAKRATSSWREVPSVSDVLNVLKTPLEWWGMVVGVRGMLELANRVAHDRLLGDLADEDSVIGLLTQHQLTVNHVRDKASDRGQAVHDALENWAATGLPPDPGVFPEEQRSYVKGLTYFLRAIPSAEPVATEVMVASVEHGFAGRYDIRVRTHEPHEIVVHRTPVRGPKFKTLMPGLYLWDLKTSKGVYPAKHFPQLEAYEGASIESGYEPTDGRGVIHVDADGNYKLVKSRTNYQHFLSILDVWKAEQAAKK